MCRMINVKVNRKNITGLKKIANSSLSIIYNNGGVESLQSVAGLTISISDKVKTV